MKFKVKPEKSNLVFMSFILLLCLITCLMWLVLRLYVYASIYFLLTILVAHTYYFTNYILEKKHLIIKLGFIKIKIKYLNILKFEKLTSGGKIYLRKLAFKIYPDNIDIFAAKIDSYLTNKNS